MRPFAYALAASIAVVGFGQVALAADIPVKGRAPMTAAAPPPPFTWSGCYIGGNVGYARADHDLSTNAEPFPPNNINATARTAIINAGLASINGSGFTGGAQVGCNWQSPGSIFVLGIEGDFNFLGADASRNTGNVVEPVSGRTVRSIDNVGMDWLATIRGRAGIAVDRLLIFATGGVAFSDIDVSKRFAWDFADGCPVVGGLNECHVGGTSGVRTGVAVGGGLEWAFGPQWSVKAEYLYVDFGDVTHRTLNVGPIFVGAPQAADHRVSTTVQIARVGLNFKFGAGP